MADTKISELFQRINRTATDANVPSRVSVSTQIGNISALIEAAPRDGGPATPNIGSAVEAVLTKMDQVRQAIQADPNPQTARSQALAQLDKIIVAYRTLRGEKSPEALALFDRAFLNVLQFIGDLPIVPAASAGTGSATSTQSTTPTPAGSAAAPSAPTQTVDALATAITNLNMGLLHAAGVGCQAKLQEGHLGSPAQVLYERLYQALTGAAPQYTAAPQAAAASATVTASQVALPSLPQSIDQQHVSITDQINKLNNQFKNKIAVVRQKVAGVPDRITAVLSAQQPGGESTNVDARPLLEHDLVGCEVQLRALQNGLPLLPAPPLVREHAAPEAAPVPASPEAMRREVDGLLRGVQEHERQLGLNLEAKIAMLAKDIDEEGRAVETMEKRLNEGRPVPTGAEASATASRDRLNDQQKRDLAQLVFNARKRIVELKSRLDAFLADAASVASGASADAGAGASADSRSRLQPLREKLDAIQGQIDGIVTRAKAAGLTDADIQRLAAEDAAREAVAEAAAAAAAATQAAGVSQMHFHVAEAGAFDPKAVALAIARMSAEIQARLCVRSTDDKVTRYDSTTFLNQVKNNQVRSLLYLDEAYAKSLALSPAVSATGAAASAHVEGAPAGSGGASTGDAAAGAASAEGAAASQEAEGQRRLAKLLRPGEINPHVLVERLFQDPVADTASSFNALDHEPYPEGCKAGHCVVSLPPGGKDLTGECLKKWMEGMRACGMSFATAHKNVNILPFVNEFYDGYQKGTMDFGGELRLVDRTGTPPKYPPLSKLEILLVVARYCRAAGLINEDAYERLLDTVMGPNGMNLDASLAASFKAWQNDAAARLGPDFGGAPLTPSMPTTPAVARGPFPEANLAVSKDKWEKMETDLQKLLVPRRSGSQRVPTAFHPPQAPQGATPASPTPATPTPPPQP